MEVIWQEPSTTETLLASNSVYDAAYLRQNYIDSLSEGRRNNEFPSILQELNAKFPPDDITRIRMVSRFALLQIEPNEPMQVFGTKSEDRPYPDPDYTIVLEGKRGPIGFKKDIGALVFSLSGERFFFPHNPERVETGYFRAYVPVSKIEKILS